MAFRDENGRITIDEIAAQQDVRNLRAAVESMASVHGTLRQVDALASSFSGDTGAAIQEVALQLAARLQELMEQAQEAAGTIEATVAKYQAIDANLKETMDVF